MPYNIDKSLSKGKQNPNAEKGTITIKPHRHHDTEEKIQQTMIDIICIMDRDGIRSTDDCWGNPDCAVRLVALYVLRNKNHIVDANGKTISKRKLVKMVNSYLKDKLPSEQRFYIEQIMNDVAQEMLDEYAKAAKELEEEEKQNGIQ